MFIACVSATRLLKGLKLRSFRGGGAGLGLSGLRSPSSLVLKLLPYRSLSLPKRGFTTLLPLPALVGSSQSPREARTGVIDRLSRAIWLRSILLLRLGVLRLLRGA